MGDWRAAHDRRAAEFESFVAGAAGRLLHVAALLTTEPFGTAAPDRCARTPEEVPAARDLLVGALARTYAVWDGMRQEDPYDRARYELVTRFSHTAWHYRRPRGGVLSRLSPQLRVVLVLRLYEDVPEEQVAAALGLSEERIEAVYGRALQLMLQPGTRPMEAHG